jgi:hypothetical protein
MKLFITLALFFSNLCFADFGLCDIPKLFVGDTLGTEHKCYENVVCDQNNSCSVKEIDVQLLDCVTLGDAAHFISIFASLCAKKRATETAKRVYSFACNFQIPKDNDYTEEYLIRINEIKAMACSSLSKYNNGPASKTKN